MKNNVLSLCASVVYLIASGLFIWYVFAMNTSILLWAVFCLLAGSLLSYLGYKKRLQQLKSERNQTDFRH